MKPGCVWQAQRSRIEAAKANVTRVLVAAPGQPLTARWPANPPPTQALPTHQPAQQREQQAYPEVAVDPVRLREHAERRQEEGEDGLANAAAGGAGAEVQKVRTSEA